MIKLIIKNQTRVTLPTYELEKWLNKTIKIAGKEIEGTLEMYFVDKQQIRALNKENRGKDSVTDVLSFSFLNELKFPGDNLVGQIFMEPEIAQEQALEHGVSWQDEIEFLFVHAVLHVIGYDHETPDDFREMFDLQEKIMPDQRWETYVNQIFEEYFG